MSKRRAAIGGALLSLTAETAGARLRLYSVVACCFTHARRVAA